MSSRSISKETTTSECVAWKSPSLYLFNNTNEARTVDIVLAFKDDEEDFSEEAVEKRGKRDEFKLQLTKNGFLHQTVSPKQSFTQDLGFLKIHGKCQTLMAYAEKACIRMPLRKGKKIQKIRLPNRTWIEKLIRKDPFKLKNEEESLGRSVVRVNAEFAESRLSYFMSDEDNVENLFSPTQRICLVWNLLSRMQIGKDPAKIGIRKLLAENVFIAAYPLHDGGIRNPRRKKNSTLSDCSMKQWNVRRQLMFCWGSMKKVFKYQPLLLIRSYFGVNVAMYFAWLGHYTMCLFFPTVVGLLSLLIGVAWMKFDKTVEETCEADDSKIMCPICPIPHCDFWKLSSSCVWYRFVRVFNHDLTPFFALFMVIWSEVSLRMWKRKEYRLHWQWVVNSKEADRKEQTRPELDASKLAKKKVNDVTHEIELRIPEPVRTLRKVMSYTSVCLMILLVVFVNFLLLVWHVVFLTQGYKLFRNETWEVKIHLGTNSTLDITYSASRVFAAVCSSTVSLIIICIFAYIYRFLAEALTKFEFPRTMAGFESSFSWKMSVLQLCNYFTPVVYLAFVKDRQLPTYEDGDKIGAWILKVPQTCGPGGCIADVCIQTTASLVFGQIGETIFTHWIWPKAMLCWNKRHIFLRLLGKRKISSRCEKDFYLIQTEDSFLIESYVAKIVQFGFVMFFSVAFPLAPLAAFVKNLLEIRFCATRYLSDFRRPIPYWYETIHTWHKIMKWMSKVAVVVNAAILSLTSDLIPRWAYRFMEGSLEGHVTDSLTLFRVEKLSNHSVCHHKTYRTENCSVSGATECELTKKGWEMRFARLAFFVAFCAVAGILNMIVDHLIKPTTKEMRNLMKREEHLAKEALMEKRTPEDVDLHSEDYPELTQLISSLERESETAEQEDQNESLTSI